MDAAQLRATLSPRTRMLMINSPCNPTGTVYSRAELEALVDAMSDTDAAMAYTLYADGSIEAELPDGTVRFGSIAELRAHIESNS